MLLFNDSVNTMFGKEGAKCRCLFRQWRYPTYLPFYKSKLKEYFWLSLLFLSNIKQKVKCHLPWSVSCKSQKKFQGNTSFSWLTYYITQDNNIQLKPELKTILIKKGENTYIILTFLKKNQIMYKLKFFLIWKLQLELIISKLITKYWYITETKFL